MGGAWLASINGQDRLEACFRKNFKAEFRIHRREYQDHEQSAASGSPGCVPVTTYHSTGKELRLEDLSVPRSFRGKITLEIRFNVLSSTQLKNLDSSQHFSRNDY